MALLRTCLTAAALLALLEGAAAFTSHGFAATARVSRSVSRGRAAPRMAAMEVLPHLDVMFAAAQGLAEEVAKEAGKGGGPLSPLISATEFSITSIHDLLKSAGVENPYGYSIILFTLGIKALTFPLNAKQLESTTKMQALNPKIKQIQSKFANNPEKANQMIAALYQEAEVNPLAGCLPSLAQIPIFISLYRSILNLSKDNVLTEPFLWLPSLEGPTYGAEAQDGLKWLTAWQDGAPMLGWHDTACFLSIPIILVVSQKISQRILTPPDSPNAPQGASATVLNILPLMVGWFSLNVPSGLGVYWIVNNIVTTALTGFLKNKYSNDPKLAAISGPSTAPAPAPEVSTTTMERPAPQGMMSMAAETVDAEVVSDAVGVADAEEEEEMDDAAGMGEPTTAQREAKKKARKAQKKARKAQRKKR